MHRIPLKFNMSYARVSDRLMWHLTGWGMTWNHFPHYWPFVRGILLLPMIPVMRSIDVYSVVSMNKLSCCRWFTFWFLRFLNTLRPRQTGRHFPDDILKWIFLNENIWISIKISLKFVPRGSINNIPALVRIMAWHRPGNKPLSEPMVVRLLTHICVTRPQWVKRQLWESRDFAVDRVLCITDVCY